MVYGKAAGITFRLPLRRDHCGGPPTSPSPGSAPLHAAGGGLAEQIEVFLARFRGSPVSIRTLLGFEYECPAPIAVYASEACGAIAIVGKDPTLKYVIVFGVIGFAAVGRRHTNQITQTVNEALRVSEF